MAGSLSEQEILNKVYDATSASLRTGVTLEGDLEVGAVEIKNGSSDQRATVDASGQLAVKEASGADIKTAVELIDDAVYTDDTSTFTPATNKAVAVGGLVDDASTDSADEGDFAALRLSARRAAMVSLDTRLDQTNDAVTIYGSDDGGTTKRVIKTDSGGAIQVDLETTSIGINGGQAADGAAVSGNPVRIGGKDGSGNTQDIITDTDGHVQVDVLSSALPTGAALESSLSALNGKVTACNTGAVVVASGAITETNSATIAGDTTSLDAKVPAKGTAAMAASMPVTLASDDTLATAIKTSVELLDNAISGTEMQVDVVAALPAGANIVGKVGIDQTTPGTTNGVVEASAAAIKTAVELIDNCISGSEAQVDVVAALPAGNNNIGDVDVASIAAGDNNIGNVDIVTLPSGNLGQKASAASLSVTPATDVADATYIGDIKFGEALPAGTNAIGAITNTALIGPGNPTVDSFANVAIAASANTANQSLVAAPGANKQIWVFGLHGAFGTDAGTIAFQDEDDTALTGAIPGALNGWVRMGLSGNFSMPLFKVATNKALEIDTVTCSFAGLLTYAIVSV